jgi:hypothetical protein
MQIYMMQKISHFLLGYLSNVRFNLFSTLPILIWVVSTIGTNLLHLIPFLICVICNLFNFVLNSSCYSLHLFLSGSNYSFVSFPNSFQQHLVPSLESLQQYFVIFKIIHSFKQNQQVTQILPNKCIHKKFTKHTQTLPHNKRIIIQITS